MLHSPPLEGFGWVGGAALSQQRAGGAISLALWGLGFGVVLVAVPTVGQAQVLPANGQSARTLEHARQLLTQATASREAGQLDLAQQQLEQAYRHYPLPEVLYQLGLVAQKQDQKTRAADLFQRYLDSAADQVDRAAESACRAFLASKRGAEVAAQVVGADGTVLLVDDRLVGVLPLPGPVLLTVAPHRFSIEEQGQLFTTDALQLPSGPTAEVRLARGAKQSAIAVIRQNPQVAVLLSGNGLPAGVVTSLSRSVEATLRKEQLSPLPGPVQQSALPESVVVCAADRGCQRKLADASKADAVLSVQVLSRGNGDYALQLAYVDGPSGDVAATQEASCQACDPAKLQALLSQQVQKVVVAGISTARGSLQVTSTPSGAALLIDGEARGQTPYQRDALVGPRTLRIEQPGFAPYQKQLQVRNGQTVTVEARLKALASSAASVAAVSGGGPSAGRTVFGRPLWRVVTGSLAVGAGLALSGFGTSALLANGSCKDEPVAPALECDQRYATLPIGSGLLGSGGALTVAGVVLLALPGSRSK